MTPQPEISAISHLILVRLLGAANHSATEGQIKKDVGPLVQHRWEGGGWTELLNQTLGSLESAGLISQSKTGRTKRSTLTPLGRQRGLEFLGISTLPPKATWAALKKTFLLVRVLDLPAPTGEHVQRFSSNSGFKASLLKKHYTLATADYPTLPEATDALAWKLLGFESDQKFTLKAVLTALFNRELGDHRQADPKKAVQQLLAKLVAARRDDPNELRQAAIRSWLDRDSARPEPPQPGDRPGNGPSPNLTTFAQRVLAAAQSSPTGRFGDNKVFISHVWRAVQDDPLFRGMDLNAFKHQLTRANHARLLSLSRADLVEAMDPEDVRTSETRYLGATFHFVRI